MGLLTSGLTLCVSKFGFFHDIIIHTLHHFGQLAELILCGILQGAECFVGVIICPDADNFLLQLAKYFYELNNGKILCLVFQFDMENCLKLLLFFMDKIHYFLLSSIEDIIWLLIGVLKIEHLQVLIPSLEGLSRFLGREEHIEIVNVLIFFSPGGFLLLVSGVINFWHFS